MKIKRIIIENYRSIKKTEVSFSDLLALVGPNNVGKSNIIKALSIILGKSYPTYTNLEIGDYHRNNTKLPVKIILTLDQLSEDDLKFFRSKARGYLRVRGSEPVRGNYSTKLNVCLELPYGEPGKFYYLGDDLEPLRYSVGGNEIVVKNDARELFPQLILIPGQRDADKYFSDSQKYDWGKLLNKLRSNANKNIDIKSILEELTIKVAGSSDFVNLNEEIRKQILEFLTDDYTSTHISLLPVNPGDIMKTVHLNLDDGFLSELNTKGDGIKSLAVIALVLLVAKQENNLVICLEEPELFLHPLALYVLNTAMQNRSKTNQVVFSSHSPFLVNVTRPKNIARVFRKNGETDVVQLPEESHWLTPAGENKIERDIDAQRNLLFFANSVILVEGPTEYLSLPTFANKLNVDLSKKGVVLVEVNGKPNIKNYSDYLTSFKIPHVVVYDVDDPGSGLNETINLIQAPKFPMDVDFEAVLVKDIGLQKTDVLLNQAYGISYTNYKNHPRIINKSLEEKVRHFLIKSKPFAAKYLAETIAKEEVPTTIKNIINKSVDIANE
ncbi:MAG TPA: AAA family ATPase [Patescibacteria group bacterium]|nr:AAA family ATPase [Patescibacteria group bacterium]